MTSAPAAGGSESVIVVLKHQYSFPETSAGATQRIDAADAAQAPVVASLRSSHASNVTQLHVIDAVAATVSPTEKSALAGNASVAEVVPNAVFKGPAPVTATPLKSAAAATLAPGTCPAPGKVQLDPEGVELGRLVYDLHDYTPDMPAGCDIRLQGVAPGISLYAYKVYANNDMTTTSAFLEAIDYAVDVDHVNVLNEEGGSFPFPDTSEDLIKEANDAAMAAGVTITSPSYDAGPESTIWSPSSQPGVISVGASTAFRTYAQDDIGEYSQVDARGWVSDNISSLSSGGSTERGRADHRGRRRARDPGVPQHPPRRGPLRQPRA